MDIDLVGPESEEERIMLVVGDNFFSLTTDRRHLILFLTVDERG